MAYDTINWTDPVTDKSLANIGRQKMRWTQDVYALKALQHQQILITRQNGLGLAMKCHIKKLIVLGVAKNFRFPDPQGIVNGTLAGCFDAV